MSISIHKSLTTKQCEIDVAGRTSGGRVLLQCRVSDGKLVTERKLKPEQVCIANEGTDWHCQATTTRELGAARR